MSRLRYLDPRQSFAAKLVVSLLLTVGLLLAVTLVVVQREMDEQIAWVAERTVERAMEAFTHAEERRREQLARRAAVFAEGPRALALLEEGIEARDTAFLAGQIDYAVQLTHLDPRSLTVLTDAFAEPFLTVVGETVLAGRDPAGVGPLVDDLLDSFDPERFAFRVVEGRLYTVRVALLELGPRVVGATAFGVPIVDEDAQAIGRQVGAEVCFVAGGECVAGTPMAREDLAPRLIPLAGTRARQVDEWEGERWELIADPLAPDESAGWLVMAVPLESVLAPFDRIRRALGLASAAAILLATLLSGALSRSLTRPVRALVDGTRRVARGDYDVRVPDRSLDELGQLARSFNAMTEGLRLKEQYRGVLDKVVSKDVAEELLRGDLRLGGESREVSILFADVRGFTALTEGMEPQAVIGLLNETMERLSAAVDAAGGVVDKYVGDEIMAVFGAPIAQPDHAARAVRAAKEMQAAVEAMNRERSARGDALIGLGVGVHTGTAVAGNMGSHDRLNYTVVGESVNLASRLCGAAAAGEILISGATGDRIHPDQLEHPAEDRAFKGFSRPVAVYVLRAVARTGTMAAVLLAGVMTLGVAGPAVAQEAPTLAGLGIGWISPTGWAQLDLSGRADLETYVPFGASPWIIPDTDPFVAPRVRLFADLYLGEHVYVAGELRADRGEEPTAGPMGARLEQVFVRLSGGPGFVQAGRFVSPVGGYPSRHHTPDDPLIRPPLKYELRTMVSASIVPGNSAAFVRWRDDPESFRAPGAPPIWGAPYPWGVLTGVTVGPVGLQVAVVNSAPSSEPDQWTLRANPFDRPTWQAVARYRVLPELAVQLYHSRGPYLESRVVGPMPGSSTVADYNQVLWGGELHFQRGLTTVRLETLHDRWEVPNVPDDPIDISYSLEARQRLGRGWAVAGRFSGIEFNVIDAAGPDYEGIGPRPTGAWDYAARRIQLGASYRVLRNVEVRAEHLWTWTASPHDEDSALTAVQVWWSF